jgi:hypothetical protein
VPTQKLPNILEIYGPIWILITLVVELNMVGHFRQIFTEGEASLANQSLSTDSVKKVSKTAFLFALYFLGTPFVLYMVFKSKQALDVSYTRLFQLFGYAYTVFIPGSFLYALIPLARLRLFVLVLMGTVSLYYIYREMKEMSAKYFDEVTLKNITWYVCASHIGFMLIFKYYLLG